MTGALFIVSIVALLAAAAIILSIAGFILQRVQKYVELAEERFETLHKSQERISKLLDGRQEASVQKIRSVETDAVDTEQKIHQLELQIQALKESRPAIKVGQTVSSTSTLDAYEATAEHVTSEDAPVQEEASVAEYDEEGDSTRGFVSKRPHPDDEVKNYLRSSTPAKKMFSEHYDRYLENYEGYVKLAQKIYEMRLNDENPEDSPERREWEQKLARANDGIKRTTARLDILEQYNPELASDQRISYRAEVAKNHSDLEKKLSNR